MNLELQDKVAVVTGASRGIGLAVTTALVREGARVVAGALSSSPDLKEAAAAGSVVIVEVDLADPSGPAALVERAGDRVDVLVNNVGGAPTRLAGFAAVTDEEWLATLTLNLLAAVRTTRAALPLLLRSPAAGIVNVVSVNAALPDPAVVDYSAAKAALAGFTKALSKELGPSGVRVNAVSPGPVATDLWLGPDGVAATVSRASGAKPRDVADAAVAGSATRRFTTPAEVADAVLFLASARAANVTGSDLRIDGGLVPTL